jgi:hypothetical protein
VKESKTMALTPEQTKKIQRAIDQTLQTIASDYFAGDDNASMSKDEIIEFTLDADYLEMYGCGYKQDKAEFKTLVEEFRKLSYDEQNKIADATWKWNRCGL